MYKNRILDIYIYKNVMYSRRTLKKCFLYKHFVHLDFCRIQPHLTKPINNNLNLTLSLIRLFSHCLNIETGRYQGESRQHKWCDVCGTQQTEDEFHFILQCPRYSYICMQEKKNNKYYYKPPGSYERLHLLDSQHTPTPAAPRKYLHYALASFNAELFVYYPTDVYSTLSLAFFLNSERGLSKFW